MQPESVRTEYGIYLVDETFEVPHYPDHGCIWSEHCLSCHLPECVYVSGVIPRGRKEGSAMTREERNSLIRQRFDEGLSLVEIGREFRIDDDTVGRIVRAGFRKRD